MDATGNALKILQVSTTDALGGAERVARNLFRSYRLEGQESWLAVGRKQTGDVDVLLISGKRRRDPGTRTRHIAGRRFRPPPGRLRGVGYARKLLRGIANPVRSWERLRGHEEFHFPGTFGLLGLPPDRPTIVHCHNLHGGYFDLRALPWLSNQVPTFLTLHDAWLLSGHCAHSLGCERWQTGCGECPDLRIYPAIWRDATAFNWRRKREIYEGSRLYVSTPCEWLMKKVILSMLVPAIVEARVIHNGVDLSIFRPTERHRARALLDIPQDAKVLVFSGHRVRTNPWKDYPTVRAAFAEVGRRMRDQRVIGLVVGEDAPVEHSGQTELRFVAEQNESEAIARYYQSADVYLHAARAETIPTTITEALACGTPVVATDVGGIPEQVIERQNGFLVPPRDVRAMAEAVARILSDRDLHRSLGRFAAEDARRRFGLKQQVESYIGWYRAISEDWQPRPTS